MGLYIFLYLSRKEEGIVMELSAQEGKLLALPSGPIGPR